MLRRWSHVSMSLFQTIAQQPGGAAPLDEKPRRAAASGPGWSEVFISPALAGIRSTAEAVAAGHSLILLHDLASPEECETLREEASEAAAESRQRSVTIKEAILEGVAEEAVMPSQVRMHIAKMLCGESQELCDRLLLRSVGRVHDHLPALLHDIFGKMGIGSMPWSAWQEPAPDEPTAVASSSKSSAATLEAAVCTATAKPSASSCAARSITRDPRLVFTPGEPACNVYTSGGCFSPHQDRQTLTVLLVLSNRDHFAGGGTAFWSARDADADAPLSPSSAASATSPSSLPSPSSPSSSSWGATWSRLLSALYLSSQAMSSPTESPSLVLTPPAGTALVFTGCVTHAGQPVEKGERTVFVASFSTTGGTFTGGDNDRPTRSWAPENVQCPPLALDCSLIALLIALWIACTPPAQLSLIHS